MTTAHSQGQNPAQEPKPKAATAAFDIRNVIAALLAIYGLVLIICSFVLDPGINADTGAAKDSADNLWVGIALTVAAVVFFAWARLRPIVFNPETLEAA